MSFSQQSHYIRNSVPGSGDVTWHIHKSVAPSGYVRWHICNSVPGSGYITWHIGKSVSESDVIWHIYNSHMAYSQKVCLNIWMAHHIAYSQYCFLLLFDA